VVSLGLRLEAKTPFLGAPIDPDNPDPNRDPNPIDWRGAQIKNLIGMDERSATGLGADVGVPLVTVPAGTQAAMDGYEVREVILALNAVAVSSLADLETVYDPIAAGQDLLFGVHRGQRDIEVQTKKQSPQGAARSPTFAT
jgi:S1-C subfamily serine protease